MRVPRIYVCFLLQLKGIKFPKKLMLNMKIYFNFAVKIHQTMIHPFTEIRYISDEIGYGVVAKRFIPMGTVTWALDALDREFTPKVASSYAKVYQDIFDTYCFRNRKGNYVLCWDHARFVNHSFNSNCLTTAYDFEIAIRDIQIGEQLTDDYGYLNIDSPFLAVSEGTERKSVYPDDLLRYHKVWDELLDIAVKNSTNVDQPLKHLVKDKHWVALEQAAKGVQAMNSILECFYDRTKEKVS